jgi:hypothetical protein
VAVVTFLFSSTGGLPEKFANIQSDRVGPSGATNSSAFTV